MTSRRNVRLVTAFICILMLFAFSANALATCYQPPYQTYIAPSAYGYGETLYATATIGVYSGPGKNYPVIGHVSGGYTVRRIGVSGDFSLIEAMDVPGYTAYVETAFLSRYYPYPVYPNYYSYYPNYYNPCYCY